MAVRQRERLLAGNNIRWWFDGCNLLVSCIPMGRCAQTTVISGASRATKIFRTGPRAIFLLPAFFLTDGFHLCCWYCCSQDAFLTAAAVRARMVAAISTIRDENRRPVALSRHIFVR